MKSVMLRRITWTQVYCEPVASVLSDFPQMFHRSQRLIQQIGKRAQGSTSQEQRVTKNVMSSMALTLQDLSVNFRSTQSSYLKREFWM